MDALLYSGILYLVGVSVVLAIRPALMFNEEGEWKEFGIGRDRDKYTWLPFWLFAVLWAIIAYAIVYLIMSLPPEPRLAAAAASASAAAAPEEESLSPPPSRKRRAAKTAAPVDSDNIVDASELQPGYYALNVEETKRTGMPHYVFLGPETPTSAD